MDSVGFTPAGCTMETEVDFELPPQTVSSVSGQCRVLLLHAALQTCPVSKLNSVLDRHHNSSTGNLAAATSSKAWTWLSDSARAFAGTFQPSLRITPGLPGCQLLSTVMHPELDPLVVEALEDDALKCMVEAPLPEEFERRPEYQELPQGMPEPAALASQRKQAHQFLQRLKSWHAEPDLQ
jgi:hypothetical protein